jgi:ClpP class serine protease
MDPQSAEYKAAQKDLAKRRNDLQVQIELQRKEFVQREAKVYLTVYREILKAVEEYAKANKIRVVLRSQRGPVNADQPEQVLQHVNRAIVWTDEALDITPIILQRLNRSTAKPEAIARTPPRPKEPATPSAKPETARSEKPDEKPPAGTPKPAKDRPKTPPKASPKKPAADKKTEAPKDAKPPGAESSEKPAKEKPKTAPDGAKKPAPAGKDSADKPARKDPPTVVRLTISGGYPEGPSSPGLFGDARQSLRTVIGRIDQAAGDDAVGAAVLRIQGSDLGRAKLHELRAAVARLRKAGKPVYAELTSAGTSQYLLAAACDEIVMVPAGTLTLPGVRAEATFYKGLLDKLGIQFDVLQMGKYKGAAESFTRTNMSPPLRESLEAMVDDTYEALVADVAKDRKLKPDQVKALIDRALFTAEAAKKAGLVDHVAYPDQFRETLTKKLGADAVKLVDDYGRKKRDTDFSGMAGMMKLMQMMLGGEPPAKATRNQKIALVYAVGMIVPGRSTTSLFGEQVLGSTTLV